MKKIVIIGASSGIGRELARLYAGEGALVGATGRRQELLYSLQLEYPNHVVTECFDATEKDMTSHLDSLVQKLGGLDMLIYSAGWGEPQEAPSIMRWKRQPSTSTSTLFWKRFFSAGGCSREQGHGHLGHYFFHRLHPRQPAFTGLQCQQGLPKAPISEGLHIKARKMKIPLYLTDVQPGFVDTKMAKGPRFWVASAPKAARQIASAIRRKRWRVYITHRWWIIAKLFKWIPSWLYHRIG